MKRLFGWLLAMTVLLTLCLNMAGAEGTRIPYLQDDADLLTAAEEAQLYQDMLPLCAYGTPLFWSTNEAGNYETLARNFYHRLLANGESGTLFVINMYSRQLTIFSDGEIYRVVTTGEAESITDNVYRMAGREDYYGCASSVYSQIYSLMAGEQIARPMKTASNALLALVLALLGVYIYIKGRYEARPVTGAAKAALPITAAAAAVYTAKTMNRNARMTKRKKTNISSDSGGGGGHGGGFSGGGGGGSSGGGGSHGF